MLKLGFVGCGGIMQEHYKHLSALGGVKFAGHCDILPERAEAAAATYGGEAFSEFEAMYDKIKPQAVFVAVPPYAHCGMEEAAAQRGIHLFVEKPVALDAAAAKRIDAAIRKGKIIASVGYCFRYYDTVEVARQVLKGKAISLVKGVWHGGMPEVWWWRRMDKSGGQILEQATHLVDLIRYLCGDVAEVYATASCGCMTNVKEFSVHDSSTVAMRLKNGATASVTSSCVCNHGGRVSLEIVTPEAVVRFQDGRVTVAEDGKTTEYLPGNNMYFEEDKAFVEAVRTGKKSKIKSCYPDALKTFDATLAANASIVSGLPIKP